MRTLIGFALCLFCAACADENAQSNVPKLAGAICDCASTTKIIELNTLVALAMEKPDSEADVVRLMESLGQEHEKLGACLKPAKMAFGTIEQKEAKACIEAIHNICPKLDSVLIDYTLESIIEQ